MTEDSTVIGHEIRRESDPMDGESKSVVTKPVTKHYDLTNALEIVAPAVVALTIIIGYVLQVLETGNTDSELGSSLPIIVSAYFILHVSQTAKRNV